ncbi:MAG: DUF2231 domain-containing protein, partial [Planctomycetota bacterium]
QDPERYIAVLQAEQTDQSQDPAEAGPAAVSAEPAMSEQDDAAAPASRTEDGPVYPAGDPAAAAVGEHTEGAQAPVVSQAPPASAEPHDHPAGQSASHDHDHGPEASLLPWIGRFHVVTVHFPIAFLLLAAACAWWQALFPSQAVRSTALLTTHLGAIAAVVIAVLGWLAWWDARYPGAEQTLLLHQIIGTATAVLAPLGSMLAGPRLEQPKRPRAWFWCLSASAVLVALAGHFGGTLIFGSDYYALPGS